MNRVMSVIGIAAAFCMMAVICNPAGCSKMDETPPVQRPESAATRPVDPADIEALIDRAEQAIRTKRSDASALLSDPRYLAARGWPRFRDLIKANAEGSRITIVTPQEPGKRLHVRLRLVETDGSPSVGALVYFYHTDSAGDYGPNDASVPLTGSDNNYARLFGYATTDSTGTIEIRTIRPGGYPDTMIPAHIHLRIWRPDRRSFGNEIWFKDDPRLNRESREEAARFGVIISPVTIEAQGRASIDAEFKLD